MNRNLPFLFSLAALVAFSFQAECAEVVMPQNRSAYYTDEPIEIAVPGLNEGGKARIELVPEDTGLSPVAIEINGAHMCSILPPRTLAPGAYRVKVDGQDTGKNLMISRGLNVSTMLMSSDSVSAADKQAAGENFLIGNAFSFGRLTLDGLPAQDLRGGLSPGLAQFEAAVKADMPNMVYMYWTGFVLHKPWGMEKSWAAPEMFEMMRVFNFHTAQRIRGFNEGILYVGTIDEPGLSWGRTPAGGLASGYPAWDEKDWYEERGWRFTDNPAADSDEDWMRYLTIRCGIMKENNAWASRDLKSVWPEAVFSTDLYAPHCVSDGCDPLNQQVNDIPSTHVFLDGGIARSAVIAALYLEKAHDPSSKISHCMNGQHFGAPAPASNTLEAFYLVRNGLLAGGIYSNWWLGARLSKEDLALVNEPALRLGPLFQEISPRGNHVAILWSFTEIGMRLKDITAKEASKKDGEQIKLMVATLPENTAFDENGTELSLNAYTVCGNYAEQVLTAHQAVNRAGYPAHILHEKILPGGALKDYKTLVIVGQSHELPADVQKAIADFTAAGGKIITDKTTTEKFKDAIVTNANFKDPKFRWLPMWMAGEARKFKTPKEGSLYATNYFMSGMVLDAVAPMRESLAQTDSRPVFKSDSANLLAEHHVGGDATVLMVLNVQEKLPDIADEKTYAMYNYAPQSVVYTLEGIKPGDSVYLIEGLDWKKVTKLENPSGPQKTEFAPGEMKLYLVTPRAPGRLGATAKADAGALQVAAQLDGLKSPWPLTVTVTAPDGREVCRLYRATDKDGRYAEVLPLGSNALAGFYAVKVESPVGNLSAQAAADFKQTTLTPRAVTGPVRVFDSQTIADFLSKKPAVTIAVGSENYREVAGNLAKDLAAHGVKASVADEKTVFKRRSYPCVWNPYAMVYSPKSVETPAPPMENPVAITLQRDASGKTTALTADGKDLGENWRKPNTVVTVGDGGYVDWMNSNKEVCYEAGCKFAIDGQNVLTVVKGEPITVKTTPEFRARWERPWSRLTSYVGGFQLPPQLTEAYGVDTHLILLGDSTTSELAAAIQAGDLLPQIVDGKYPGPGRALVSFAWSPFALEKNAILIGASDVEGLAAGVRELVRMTR